MQAATVTAPDVAFLWHDWPYMQYEQTRIDENFRQYFEGIVMWNKTLRTGMYKTPYQKNYKIKSGASSYKVEFTGTNRLFDYLDISLVYDKSDAHKTIYDSYDLELASTLTKNVKLGNASNNCSLSNDIYFDFENDFDEKQLHKQFVTYDCKGCSLAPLIDYVYNKIFH